MLGHSERVGGTDFEECVVPAHELRLGDVNGPAQLANKLPAADSRCEDEQKQTLRGTLLPACPCEHGQSPARSCRRAKARESARGGHGRLIIPWRYSELGHRVL
jgi:hypothetical protein